MKYNESKWKKDTSFSTIPIYNILNKSNEPFNLQQPKLDTIFIPISDLSFPQSSNNENNIEKDIIKYDEDDDQDDHEILQQTITEPMTENETFDKEITIDEIVSVFDTTAYYKYFMTIWNKYVSIIVNINPINVFIYWISSINIKLFNILHPPPNTNDYTLINSNMFNVIKILISFFITYNIFFVFFYKKVDNISLFLKQITQYNDFIIFKYLLTPLKYLIYALFYLVDKWEQRMNFIELNGNIPKNTHRKITFCMLFLVSIYFSMKMISYVYKTFLNSIRFNRDNANSNMVIIIILCAIFTLIVELKFVIIQFIVLIIFSIMNSWFSVLLVCLLIFTITIFPMILVYNIGVFEKFKEINNYCNSVTDDDSENSNPNPIYEFFKWLVFNKIYSHMFEIVLIILFITQISNYYKNINNENLKIVLISICSFFISIFLVNIGMNTIYNVNIFDKYSTYILKGITILIFLILLYNYIDIIFFNKMVS